MGLIKDQLRSADIVLVDLDGCLIASGKPLPGAQKLIHAADDKLVCCPTAPEIRRQNCRRNWQPSVYRFLHPISCWPVK